MIETKPSSLFASVYYKDPQREQAFNFNGTVQKSLVQLSDRLSLRQHDLPTIALSCAVLEGLIDFHSDHPERDDLIDLRSQAVAVAQAIQQEDLKAGKLLAKLQQAIPPEVATYTLQQKMDSFKWSANDPLLTKRTVEKVTQHTRQPALVIAIAKTAIISGLDFAQEYAKATGQDVSVYPMRVSIHRRRREHVPEDSNVTITDAFKQHLRTLAEGKNVIVFDELFHLGWTREACQKMFVDSDVFPSGTNVYLVANSYQPAEPYDRPKIEKHIVS